MDRIDLLEAKIKEMISMVQSLRGENQTLVAQLAEAREQLSGAGEERELLDKERDVVKDRIEQLLGDLENAQAGAQSPAPSAAADMPEINLADEVTDTDDSDGPAQTSLDTEADHAHISNPVLPGLS